MDLKQNVAVVVGSTGIVGQALVDLLSKADTPGGSWKVYGLARRPRPNWLSPTDIYVQCDLLNRDDTLAKLSPLTDVTHVFWVTWVPRSTEAENCVDNGKMLRNALDALVPNAKGLEHIVLQTGAKHYIGSFESFTATPNDKERTIHETPYTEDLPRLPLPNFYYTLEDILFETVKQQQGRLTWSVHRPGNIFGLAFGNAMNLLGTFAVYAAICKHQGLPFVFPGNRYSWEVVQDAVNSDLIAEQEVWAATDSRGKNQAFNVMNGDFFKWRKLWKLLAEKLGVEFTPYSGKGISLCETMKDMGPVWDQIVLQNGLQPSKLEDVAHWWFADILLNADRDTFMSLNKSKEHGFSGFRNTEKTFLSYIDQMRERKIIPSYT